MQSGPEACKEVIARKQFCQLCAVPQAFKEVVWSCIVEEPATLTVRTVTFSPYWPYIVAVPVTFSMPVSRCTWAANLVGVNMVTWCLGWAGGHYHIRKFMFLIPSPQTYWTAVVAAQGTAGAQNFHNTAKIVSNLTKCWMCTVAFLCDIVNCV